MQNEMSKQLKRYYKNKDKYNERAKIYYNTVYYPAHKEEILKKAEEYRKKNPKARGIYYKPMTTPIIRNKSLIVSFD